MNERLFGFVEFTFGLGFLAMGITAAFQWEPLGFVIGFVGAIIFITGGLWLIIRKDPRR